MKRILAICLFGVVLCSSNLAQAVDWQVVYQTDFSTDPGWTTNSPSNMYWDSASQRFHLKSWDGGNQYVYVPISYNPSLSYKLEYDIEVVHHDWASDVRFGIGDPDMDVFEQSTWSVDYCSGDGGNGTFIEYHSDGSRDRLPQNIYEFLHELNTVYHNIIIYDGTTQTLIYQVVYNGTVVLETPKTYVGIFGGVDRLYSSSIGDDYAPGAIGEGYIDNVVLSVPEPATLLLFGLGGLTLLRKKKH